MFLEPHFQNQRIGCIEIIVGSMFSGKTEELLRRLRRSQIARQKVGLFKIEMDDRYSEGHVVSHDSSSMVARRVNHSDEISRYASDLDVVGIDEVQFFDEGIVEVCQDLASRGKRLIAAGLDMDFSGKPFGAVPDLMAMAEYVTKLHAICQQCGRLANHSYRLLPSRDQILLGASEQYEARCRVCFGMGNILDFKSVDN